MHYTIILSLVHLFFMNSITFEFEGTKVTIFGSKVIFHDDLKNRDIFNSSGNNNTQKPQVMHGEEFLEICTESLEKAKTALETYRVWISVQTLKKNSRNR